MGRLPAPEDVQAAQGAPAAARRLVLFLNAYARRAGLPPSASCEPCPDGAMHCDVRWAEGPRDWAISLCAGHSPQTSHMLHLGVIRTPEAGPFPAGLGGRSWRAAPVAPDCIRVFAVVP